jgi:O-antigen/teichoic acid export membrane protein
MLGSETNMRKNYFWNTLGTGLYAMATMILTIVVSWCVNSEQAGVFALALTVGQWMTTISYYETKVYQVTDIKEKYTFSDFFVAKTILLVLAIIASIIFIVVREKPSEKAIIILFMCVYKTIEGFADVFEGEFQRRERVDAAGKSIFIRVITSNIIFIGCILITRNLLLSIIIMTIESILVIYVFNYYVVDRRWPFSFKSTKPQVFGIFKDCFPLFLSTFLNTYIFAASRLAVDAVLDDEYQLFYVAIFMPITIINLFSGFVFKPLLTNMAECYESGNIKDIKKMILKIIGFIFGFTLICIIGAYLIGIPVLSFIYHVDLSAYKFELLILLVAGGINALNVVLYYILTIMRKQYYVLFGYALTAVMAFIITKPMTKALIIRGASLSYLANVAILLIVFSVYTGIQIVKIKQKNQSKEIV